MEQNERGDTVKISELLLLDIRKDGSIELIKEALRRLPFFSEASITTDSIEEAIKKMQKKYPVKLSYIMGSSGDNDEEPATYYSLMIKRIDTHEHIKTIYAITLFEGLAKTAIFMFGYIKNTLKNEERTGGNK